MDSLLFSLGVLVSDAFARGLSLGFLSCGEVVFGLWVFPASIFYCFDGFVLVSPLARFVSSSSFERTSPLSV